MDPTGGAPQAAPRRFATVADLRVVMSGQSWRWEGWVPAARLVGVGGSEGTGKTRFCLDLCRRVYLGLPWPDGQEATLPKGTKSVWVCSDAHHDELAATVTAFGLPDEAVLFPTLAEDPYGGPDLDDAKTMVALAEVVASERPAFVFIDTLTSATSRNLCDQQVMKGLKAPLAGLCQEHGVTVVLMLHLNREGQALGRRIKGITRTLIHLECPDPEGSPKLRLWVEKSFAKKPPALGVTMGEAGNDYDFEPPRPPEKGSSGPVGRPPARREKAVQFLTEKLTEGDCRAVDLVAQWEDLGGNKGTLFTARSRMVGQGLVVVDDSKKPQVWHLNREAGGATARVAAIVPATASAARSVEKPGVLPFLHP